MHMNIKDCSLTPSNKDIYWLKLLKDAKNSKNYIKKKKIYKYKLNGNIAR